MTAVEFRELTARPATPVVRVRAAVEWRFMWAAIVICGVLGIISGLAQGNALYAGNGNLVPLLLWTIIGIVSGVGIGAALGASIDLYVARAKRTAV